jgi:Leucine-rich repeat (LRR) protein
MKKTVYTLIFTAAFTCISHAQNVNITDANFKNYLLAQTGINTNLDSEIQTSEASSYTGVIDIGNLNISDLTGIEEFVLISALYAGGNNLTTLDLSNNTSLTEIDVNSNQITSININGLNQLTYLGLAVNQCNSLDISTNQALQSLDFSYNNLTSIDLQNNTNLTYLLCPNNNLTSLDVSLNPNLTGIFCQNNQITILDISTNASISELYCLGNELTSLLVNNGNNNNFTTFNATNNSNLACIQVDDINYSNTNWAGFIDLTSSFSENCSAVIGIEEQLRTLNVFPNPAKDYINVSAIENTDIKVLNTIGQAVLHQKNISTSTFIDISQLSKGLYYIQANGYKIIQFVKE